VISHIWTKELSLYEGNKKNMGKMAFLLLVIPNKTIPVVIIILSVIKMLLF
jgi:hypothetical protein